MSPLVSVLICIYNSVPTLRWALASVLSQTYKNWEAIIVDDGSTDHPEALVQEIRDKRIKFFRLSHNVGRGAARQFALTKIRGEYVSVLDGDDWLYPSKLQSQIEIMQNDHSLVLCSSALANVGPDNCLSGISGSPRKFCDMPVIGETRPNWIKAHFPGSLMRSSEAKQIGFNKNLRRSEDFDFLLKLLWGHRFYLMARPVYAYRTEEAVTSNTSLTVTWESLQSCRETLKNYETEFPVLTRYMILQSYGLLFRTCLRRILQIPERHRQANHKEIWEFEEARAGVASQVQALFGQV